LYLVQEWSAGGESQESQLSRLVAGTSFLPRVVLSPLQVPLSRYSEFEDAFGAATERRKTGSTNINATSSRSHAILEITCWDSDFKYQLGKLRLLDLAGKN